MMPGEKQEGAATLVGSDRDGLIGIEHAAVRAWPAGETRDVDGWLWRFSGGGSQRANSVSALEYRGDDVERSIDTIENLYREHTLRFVSRLAFRCPSPTISTNVSPRAVM
jgi:hypothetical protein